MFSDQQKLGSEPLVCHRSRLASRFLQFNVLQIRRPRRRWSALITSFLFATGGVSLIRSSRRVRTEPVMYVGKRQPRFREGKGLVFKSRGFVGYLHKYKRATPTIIGKLHGTHPLEVS